MAKIILVVNVHPSETAFTVPLATYLKSNLKRRGHEVEIIGVPPKKTILYQVQEAAKAGTKIPYHSMFEPSDEFIVKLASQNPKSYIFDIHCGPHYYLNRNNKKIKRVSAGLLDPNSPGYPPLNRDKKNIEITPYSFYPPNYFCVEAIAVFKEAPEKLKALLKSIKCQGLIFKDPELWFGKIVDLKTTRKAGYLSDTIVRKVAHQIDSLVQTREGRYRKINLRLRRLRDKRKIKRQKKFRI
ncbi:MAG: hypothetical protein AB1467_02275 [Candidatus Diapherotrites archaeon]